MGTILLYRLMSGELAQAVGVDAGTLGRGQVVDAPPAHLQEDEGDEETPFCLCAP